jgi:hypothetical protein
MAWKWDVMAWHGMECLEKAWQWHGMEMHGNGVAMTYHGNDM